MDEIEIDSDRRLWHWSRSISFPLLVLLLVNILGGVWWGATLEAKEIAHYNEMLARTNDRISRSETEDKLKHRDIQINNITKNIDQLQAMFQKIDDKLDKLLNKG